MKSRITKLHTLSNFGVLITSTFTSLIILIFNNIFIKDIVTTRPLLSRTFALLALISSTMLVIFFIPKSILDFLTKNTKNKTCIRLQLVTSIVLLIGAKWIPYIQYNYNTTSAYVTNNLLSTVGYVINFSLLTHLIVIVLTSNFFVFKEALIIGTIVLIATDLQEQTYILYNYTYITTGSLLLVCFVLLSYVQIANLVQSAKQRIFETSKVSLVNKVILFMYSFTFIYFYYVLLTSYYPWVTITEKIFSTLAIIITLSSLLINIASLILTKEIKHDNQIYLYILLVVAIRNYFGFYYTNGLYANIVLFVKGIFNLFVCLGISVYLYFVQKNTSETDRILFKDMNMLVSILAITALIVNIAQITYIIWITDLYYSSTIDISITSILYIANIISYIATPILLNIPAFKSKRKLRN